MTYCVAMRLDAGLVFLSDSRTNAGVDLVNTFRKMTVFERAGDRVVVLTTAGNLAISQTVRHFISEGMGPDKRSIWNVNNMFEAAQLIGDAIREVHRRDGNTLKEFQVEFNVSFMVGGQIKGESSRLFNIYSAGNFIEAQAENCYFQIGEAKYGKPILDRIIYPSIPLDEAVKCALVSMDSTLRSNISVGLPLDLLVYEADSFHVTRFACLDGKNQYFQMIRDEWGKKLRDTFNSISNPVWGEPSSPVSLQSIGLLHEPVRATLPLFDNTGLNDEKSSSGLKTLE